MNNIRTLSDTAAIGLSLLCAIHCLMLPLVLVWLPTAMALTVGDEIFHVVMVLLVIPLSLYALLVGCKQHKRFRVLMLGCIGLSLLLAAIFLGHDYLGDIGEKVMTVIGAGLVAVGHWFNYQLCQSDERCDCGS